MTLTQEQFKELRNKGLSVEQIHDFELRNTQVAKPKSFLRQLGEDIVRPIAEVGVTAYNEAAQIGQTAKALATGQDQVKNEMVSRNVPFLGEVKPAFTGQETTGEATKKIAGYGAEIGSWVVGGGGATQLGKQTLKGAVKQGIKTGVKTGAVSGVLSGAGREAQNLGDARDIATGGVVGAVGGAVLGGAIGAAAPAVAKGVKKLTEPIETKVSSILKQAIDKGIKPGLKQSAKKVDEYYTKAAEAFRIIKKYAPEITDEEGEAVVRAPETRREMLEGLNKAKSTIYNEYHQAAIDAGTEGVKYNPANALGKLDEVANSKKYNPEIRGYAEKLKTEVEELAGESPEVVEARIQDLNSSLTGFYEGRVSKAKAQIDASTAALMRSELDDMIEKSTGVEYQALKNEYGALKTVEKDLTRQVLVEARRNPQGLIDLPNIFTGADLLVGAMTGNPAQFAKGMAGQGIKWYMKYLNNPNRYIKKAFDVLDKEAAVEPGSSVISRAVSKVKNKKGSAKIEPVIAGGALAAGAATIPALKKERTLDGIIETTDSKKNEVTRELDVPVQKRVEYTVSDDQKKKVLATIFAEALGESPEGRQAIFNVINNRLENHKKYLAEGKDIFSVISAKNQFSAFDVNNKLYSKARDYLRGKKVNLSDKERQVLEEISQLYDKAASGQLEDLTGGADFYYNPDTASSYDWQKNPSSTKKIGKHLFVKKS